MRNCLNTKLSPHLCPISHPNHFSRMCTTTFALVASWQLEDGEVDHTRAKQFSACFRAQQRQSPQVRLGVLSIYIYIYKV